MVQVLEVVETDDFDAVPTDHDSSLSTGLIVKVDYTKNCR